LLTQTHSEYDKLEGYLKELSELSESLDQKSMRWLELDEIVTE
jgi:hypothetical protein